MSTRILRVVGVGESGLEAQLKDLIDQQSNPTIAPYAKLGEVHLRLTGNAADEQAARQLLEPLEEEIRQRLGNHVYGADETTLAAAVGGLLEAGDRTLAVAESCTGGLLGQRLTTVPGSSGYFNGGIIAYSNTVKESVLGVEPGLLRQHGAVSEQVAAAMARGAAAVVGADTAVAITGVAGPGGGTAAKPVGLVYVAWLLDDDVQVKAFTFPGDRDEIRWRTSQAALDGLRRQLLERG